MTNSIATCDIQGGLGNQLFQIATTLAYAWKHDKTALFLKKHTNGLNQQTVRLGGAVLRGGLLRAYGGGLLREIRGHGVR